jgi:hypothetical protein
VDSTEQNEAIEKYRDKDFEKILNPAAFCIATFSIELPPPFVDHCGFVLERGKYFIHILRQHSVVKQRLNHRILRPKLQGFYKLREQCQK